MFCLGRGLGLVNFEIPVRHLSGDVEDTGKCVSQREVWAVVYLRLSFYILLKA